MTYNLCFGGADRFDAIHTVIAHAAPDAVALTEADDPRIVADLAARLGMEHVWARGSGDRHIALLSRFPIKSWRIYNRPPLTQAILETKLEISNLESSTPHRQSLISLYSVHLLPYLLLPFEIRRAQALNALLKIIQRDCLGPHLILGDLNAIAPGDRVLQHKNPARMRRVMALQANIIFHLAIPRLLRAGYVDCYRACHPHPLPPLPLGEGPGVRDDGFTWHTGNRTTRYDYIFADPFLASRLRDCRVVDDIPAVETASDHYPIVAAFDL
ncbi:MAG: endonuclease/exonuclease/phosphatase family protein [Chloroflexi bacterium]|nr:endonuclease/exonuclease/phosphatase family protein [Chloroflexota bacterium]